jgi:hypothetical protein
MPNWVYNTMNVNGSKEDLIAFRDKASKTRPDGLNTEDGSLTYTEGDKSELSFWNFIEPEDKALYFGASDYKPDGYNDWSVEDKMAYSMKFSSNGWYDWNVREWGTKWDASDVDFTDNTDDKAPFLNYAFQTAWSIPEPVFHAIVRQHPELSFDFYSEEEQGWGAEFTSSDADDVDEDGKPTKSLIMTKEWDIPDSHADYVELGRDCWACESGDEDDLYEDCPREDRDFVVVVERRYVVKAQNAEQAWELAQDGLDNLEPEDADSFRVVDENTGEHLFPKYEDNTEE